jgi:calcium-dependent protein kinase
LSAEEVEDIKEMFKAMDTDNDGVVSCEELKSGIAKFGSHLAESEVQMLIEAVSIGKIISFHYLFLLQKLKEDMCEYFLRRSIGG